MAKRRKRKSSALVWIIMLAVVLVVLAGVNYDTGSISMQPKILVIPLRGDLTLYSSSSLFSGSSVSAEQIVGKIQDANENPSIGAIILEINSPGGTVVASEEIAKAVEDSEKPVVAWIREVGASGGYYVASSCDKIVADRASLTGSIGVTASFLQYSELMERYGVTYERVVTGKYKDIGSPFKELTQEERSLLEMRVDMINEMFVQHISRTRAMNIEDVRALATGEFMLGEEAFENGLVDVLGSETEAKKEAETLAGIEDAKLVTFIEKKSLFEQLVDGFVPFSSYYVGRGIGDALTEEQDFSLKF